MNDVPGSARQSQFSLVWEAPNSKPALDNCENHVNALSHSAASLADEMASQRQSTGPSTSASSQDPNALSVSQSHRPTDTLIDLQLSTESRATPQDSQAPTKKRKNHRAGKKTRRNRRQSFLPSTHEEDFASGGIDRPAEPPTSATAQPSFYRVNTNGGKNLSETSLDSDALLDHR